MIYRTKEGDVVDGICYQQYQRSDLTPQIYEMNSALVDYGPVLPAGLFIELPEPIKPEGAVVPKISLFD